MRSGIVGTSVTALVRDVRRVLEPNTASHLRVKFYSWKKKDTTWNIKRVFLGT